MYFKNVTCVEGFGKFYSKKKKSLKHCIFEWGLLEYFKLFPGIFFPTGKC